MSKTCWECRFYNPDYNLCFHWRHEDINEHSPICNYFKPNTHGDIIKKSGNVAIAEISWSDPCLHCAYSSGKCKRPVDKTCKDGMLAWLNTPAESEVEDE